VVFEASGSEFTPAYWKQEPAGTGMPIEDSGGKSVALLITS
jgi:hypothetical protein